MNSVIKLIRHFSILNYEKLKEDASRTLSSIPLRRYRSWLTDVLDHLDDQRREQRLFDCLAVPNDDVRLCAIKCLGETPVGQFDASEISKLVHIMLTMNGGDITAGETEYVLGNGFHLLTRLLLSVDGDQPRNFRTKGQQVNLAMRAAWKILNDNCKRDTYMNVTEDIERFALTKSLLEFLSACSVWSHSEMYNYLYQLNVDLPNLGVDYEFEAYSLKEDVSTKAKESVRIWKAPVVDISITPPSNLFRCHFLILLYSKNTQTSLS